MVTEPTVMDVLLSGEPEKAADNSGLEQLIYRDPATIEEPVADQHTLGQVWTASRDRVTIQTWDTRASIKIRLNPDTDRDLSMRRIAERAVRAIVEELRGLQP